MLLNIADATIAKKLGLTRDKTCVVGKLWGLLLLQWLINMGVYECAAGGMGIYNLKILRDGSDENIYSYQDDYEEMGKFWGNDRISLSIFLLNLTLTK